VAVGDGLTPRSRISAAAASAASLFEPSPVTDPPNVVDHDARAARREQQRVLLAQTTPAPVITATCSSNRNQSKSLSPKGWPISHHQVTGSPFIP